MSAQLINDTNVNKLSSIKEMQLKQIAQSNQNQNEVGWIYRGLCSLKQGRGKILV